MGVLAMVWPDGRPGYQALASLVSEDHMDGKARQLVMAEPEEVVDVKLVDDDATGAGVAVPADWDRHLSPETVAALTASRGRLHPSRVRSGPREVRHLAR